MVTILIRVFILAVSLFSLYRLHTAYRLSREARWRELWANRTQLLTYADRYAAASNTEEWR